MESKDWEEEGKERPGGRSMVIQEWDPFGKEIEDHGDGTTTTERKQRSWCREYPLYSSIAT